MDHLGTVVAIASGAQAVLVNTWHLLISATGFSGHNQESFNCEYPTASSSHSNY